MPFLARDFLQEHGARDDAGPGMIVDDIAVGIHVKEQEA